MDAEEKKILKQKEEHIEQELRQIYENEEGEMPDLSSLDTPKRSWRKTGLMISCALFALTVLIWIGFFVFGGATFTSQDEYMRIEITSQPIFENTDESSPLIAGIPSRVLIRYENKTRTPIASLSIRVNLPESFTVDKFVPEPTGAGNTWQLGSLAAKSDGLIELFGTLVGTVPSVEKIQVIASYRPANFNSEFDSIIVEDLPLERSAVELKFETTDKASPGEDITLTYELLNPTREAVNHIELRVVAPPGFQASRSEPQIGEGLAWQLPRLEAHSKAAFSLTGTFSADTKGINDVGGEAYLGAEKTFLQTRVTRAMDIFGGAISANLIINGSARDQNVAAGSLLRVSLPYENGSEIDVKDVEISLEIESHGTLPIDWNNEAVNMGGGERSGNTIRWDAKSESKLALLSPGDSGAIDLTLPLAESGDTDKISFNASIGATLTTGASKRQTLSITPVVISINSNVSIYSSAVYHDTEGNTIGAGPLPPKVGETTQYAIIWTIQNSLHALENIICETELPEGVEFVESSHASAGSITYNRESHKVRWEISGLESGASARFNVSVTPTTNDVGTFLKLSNPMSLTARDSVTSGSIKLDGEILTTQLYDDAFATDDGVVVTNE